jgi:hypothetical protein
MPKYLHENGIDLITPKDPTPRNPLRKVMKGKGEKLRKKLARMSLEVARNKQISDQLKTKFNYNK